MGVAVLNHQDCLKTPSSPQSLISPSPNMKLLKPPSNHNKKFNHNNINQHNHTKRSLKRNKCGEELHSTAADQPSKTAKKSGRGNSDMGVAVLNPQDCLKPSSSQQPLISPAPHMKLLKPPSNPNTKSKQTHRNQRNHTKRGLKSSKHGEKLPNVAANRVSKTTKKSDRENFVWCSAGKPSPKSEMTLMEKVPELYSGSLIFAASPPPSAVPMPNFFSREIKCH